MTIRAVERAFALLDILRTKTDQAHPLTVAQLEEHLSERGHEQARQSIVAGLKTLAAVGYDIQKEPDTFPSAYFLGKRELAPEDAETIADMLSASRYVTSKQANRITKDCTWPLSNYQREDIALATQVVGRRTEQDADWSHNARMVRRAITNHQNLSYIYIDYDPQGIPVARHDNKRYLVCPLALIYTDGTYYMQATEDGIKAKTYRVDHMRNVSLEEATIDATQARANLDIDQLTERTFSMYSASDGKDRRIELLVEPDCAASVIDYFKDRRSCKMACTDLDGTNMSVTVTIQPSPTFFGWVAQYLGGVRILAPDDLRRSFAQACAKLTDTAS